MQQQTLQQLIALIDDKLYSLQSIQDSESLEAFRVSIMGKNGLITQAFSELSSVESARKKELATKINQAKKRFDEQFLAKKQEIFQYELEIQLKQEKIDSSLFYARGFQSHGHPIAQMRDMIIDYFIGLNFSLQDGPFIEDDFHNFEALNIPKFHPARNMQDTFYFKDSMLLRTHTSPTQIRTMQTSKLPIRMICAGPTFRRDYDVTHSPMFHQCEGLVVESGDHISFAHLKYILEDFVKHIFGEEVNVRFRSSFFPFTEPSAEVDVSCMFCDGKGCKVCSHTGYLEVLGCGVVDSNVFKAVKLDGVSGYAFGMGIERLAMLKWGINDLRSFYETDLRILEQF
ncbi:phenylalanine--tRNA ligase subunit alpha [Helicobacter muridarum]|uniref:Phenylalanine--tRNA ligase alpha subunit n=1 Tax=Helicobacter muridarum TaxID=216 RepID=A0A377PU18_9HELI|nr:phenylalanine--tRNA ligase subunit alpha [Helicobacter muridarum]TLE01122.1 phenylalanine--tRNA ligase subunit alpha [Helicobacter muridarum]STQ85989.1 phenylalanyl-tRNA synthetase subunit alpha [Helicobacter muridarum]